MAGPVLQINIGANVAQAVAGLGSLGSAAENTFDEIAAGQAAMDRITRSINAAAAAALNAGHPFDSLEQNVISTITPLNTLEGRLQQIRDAIGRSATVQGAANLGAQYEVINRNLAETRSRIDAATNAAVGLGRAFNAITSSGTGLNRLSPAIRPVLTDLRLIPPAANAAAASLSRIRPGALNGSVALNDFSRIVQDVPFGMVAIGNNITQLVVSFGDLQRSAGGTGAAFRALFSSATGFGGFSLIISAITTAVTFASVGFGAWTRGMGGSKKAADEADEATKKLLESIKSVSSVIDEATGSTRGQAEQVQSLANIITDSSKAYDIRKRALQELQQVNKSYFGDLKMEDAATGALTAKVNEYTKALVAQAVVKGYVDEISRISTALIEQQRNTDKARTKFRQLEAEYAKTQKIAQASAGYADQSAVLSRLEARVDGARKAFEEQRKAEEDAFTARAVLVGALQRANEEALKFADLSGKGADASKKETDALKQRIDALKELRDTIGLTTAQQREFVQLEIQLLQRDGVKLGFTQQEVQDRIDELIRSTRFGAEASPVEVRVPISVVPATGIDIAGGIIPGGIADTAFDGVINAIRQNAATKQAAITEALRDSLVRSVEQGAVEAFATVGDTIGAAFGAALTGGDFGAAISAGAQTLLNGIGGVLQEVGKQIIATSTLIKALKEALKSLFANPVAGIAVGIGLVALGGLLKNIKFPAFADGITSFTGGLALVGERGPELVRLPAGSDVINNRQMQLGQQQQRVIVEGIIRGRDIFLTNNRAAQTNSRI